MDIVKKKKIKELNLTPKKKVLPHRSFNGYLANDDRYNIIFSRSVRGIFQVE